MKRKSYYVRKIKLATHLLFYKHHRKPGVKGWELRRRLGSEYPKVLDILDSYLEKLDLQIKTVFEEKPAEKAAGSQKRPRRRSHSRSRRRPKKSGPAGPEQTSGGGASGD